MYSTSSSKTASTVASSSSEIVTPFVFDGRGLPSALQVPVDQIDLLEPPQALADVLGALGSDSVDGGELFVGGRKDLLQPAQLVGDLLDDKLGNARDPAQHAVAARADREVQGVDLAVVADQLGEATEVEHVLVGHPAQGLEHRGQVLLGILDRVVADQRGLVSGDADHRLLQLHLDQPTLGAELDDVALDLDGHPGDELGSLKDGEDVVEARAAL